MTDAVQQRQTRRAVLARVAGAAAGGAALALGVPATASGDNGLAMTLGQVNTATAATSLTTAGAHGFACTTDGGDAFRGNSSAPNASGAFGAGSAATSFGVYGINLPTNGRAALGAPTAALWATQGGATWAMQVIGKVSLSRSGRATVKAGHASVDVDLRARGGLGGSPMAFATIQQYRVGIAVASVRANYPSAGRMRIYLTKAPSSSTKVAWMVLG
jgi:hypothetical protein